VKNCTVIDNGGDQSKFLVMEAIAVKKATKTDDRENFGFIVIAKSQNKKIEVFRVEFSTITSTDLEGYLEIGYICDHNDDGFVEILLRHFRYYSTNLIFKPLDTSKGDVDYLESGGCGC
jgi:hypothetical protein